MDETIRDIVLACITYSGRSEDDLLADYERRCKRKKIIPLYGQVRTALIGLHREGMIKVVTIDGHKLCRKVKR